MPHWAIWVLCSLVALVGVLGEVVISDHLKARRERKRQRAAGTISDPAPSPQTTTSLGDREDWVPTPIVSQSRPESKLEPELESEEEEEESAVDAFHKELEEAIARGGEFKEAFRKTLGEQGSALDFDDALQEAFDMKFKMEDLVALMAERHHTLGDIADFVKDKEDPDFEGLFKAIAPAANGDSANAKAEEILDVITSFFDLGNDEGETLVTLLTDLGCSAEEVATLAYQKTSMDFGEVVVAAKITDQTALVASLAKKLDADLSDQDPYAALRDGGVDFVKAAALLKACGKQVVEVLDTENNFDDSILSADDLKRVVDDLLGAGFTQEEVLDGIYHAEFTDGQNSGAIVGALSDAKVPLDDIIRLILKEDVDPDDLDEELRDGDVDIRERVKILHAFFEATDRQKQVA